MDTNWWSAAPQRPAESVRTSASLQSVGLLQITIMIVIVIIDHPLTVPILTHDILRERNQRQLTRKHELLLNQCVCGSSLCSLYQDVLSLQAHVNPLWTVTQNNSCCLSPDRLGLILTTGLTGWLRLTLFYPSEAGLDTDHWQAALCLDNPSPSIGLQVWEKWITPCSPLLVLCRHQATSDCTGFFPAMVERFSARWMNDESLTCHCLLTGRAVRHTAVLMSRNYHCGKRWGRGSSCRWWLGGEKLTCWWRTHFSQLSKLGHAIVLTFYISNSALYPIVFSQHRWNKLWWWCNTIREVDALSSYNTHGPTGTSLTFAPRGQVFLQVTSIPTVVNAFIVTHQTERDTLPIPAGEVGLAAALGLVESCEEEHHGSVQLLAHLQNIKADNKTSRTGKQKIILIQNVFCFML